MASINGLPPTIIPGTGRTNKSSRKKVNKSQQQVALPSKVADAVAHSIRHVSQADVERAQLQYDLPEGRARRAMEEYMDVMNQARREELAQLVGVDIYV
ncbi:chromosome partitioning protein ParA [Vibrio navarrensis]|uniref:chromosome partitioning protein ParA n=1 Tax=Vibrio navarrensis TaxID=29495 RepID=UPI00192F349F|nr:chromosome partitioning protein ParA [Vibrio navarrensis]MBE3668733.1 chromosome partitioning protein ParA [Vibrio navarrensis]